MNRIEFDEWVDYHGLHHYEFASFCAKQADTDFAYHERQLKAWRDTLYEVSLDSAKDASLELSRGKLDEPKGPGDAVRIVAREARKLDQAKARDRAANAPRMIDGEYAARCHVCRDDGIVSVVAYDAIRRFLDTGRLSGGRESVVACSCEAGNRYADLSRGQHRLQRYDPECMPSWPSPLLDHDSEDWEQRPAREVAAACAAACLKYLAAWLLKRGHHVPDPPQVHEFVPAATTTIEEEAEPLPF